MRTSPSSRARGASAERRARLHYRLRGYRILDANVWAGGHELDVVARRGRVLVFCEVKAKLGAGYGEPAEMVGAEKQRRLRQAAESWLAAHPDLCGLEMRFDVVTVERRTLKRMSAAFVIAMLVAGVVTAAASARRKPTRGERIAIAAAVKRTHPAAPARCYPLSISVSTVNRRYASADFSHLASCRALVGDGIFLLRWVRPGRWRILSQGTEHTCSEAPRGVIRDLLGTCS
jgi:putative endonuclease